MKTLLAAALLAAAAISPALAATLEQVGRFESTSGEEGAVETVAYHAATRRLYVSNAAGHSIDIIDISAPAAARMIGSLDLAGRRPNSVAISGDRIAVAVEGADRQSAGAILLFDAGGGALADFPAGVQPDSVAFSPDGRFIITANEGEPNDDYTVNPEGSFTVVDLASGVAGARVTQISLDASFGRSVHMVDPRAGFAADAEPEYVVVGPDSRTAWATIQENNAVAVIDLEAGRVVEIADLGTKNWSGLLLDASDKDGGINRRNWPVLGLYQPDAIAAAEIGGRVVLVMANEGDAKDYEGFSEETRVGKVQLDPTVFPDGAALSDSGNLGRLKMTMSMGDFDGDGDFDAIYSYGARSFSIRDGRGNLIFDSGDAFEQIIEVRTPDRFNADGRKMDGRSDDKGCEPQAVAIGQISGRHYAFIGLERANGIMVYDLSNPVKPRFLDYVVNDQDAGPEGMIFIGATDSPTGRPMLAVAFESSNSIGLYEFAAPLPE